MSALAAAPSPAPRRVRGQASPPAGIAIDATSDHVGLPDGALRVIPFDDGRVRLVVANPNVKHAKPSKGN